jgi:ribosomal-protein-alanine N-acetyltransferase
VPDDVTIRPCVVADAAALAAMYEADGDQILATEPATAAAFFTVDGQRERISRIWPEHDCRGFVAERGDRIVGLMLLQDIVDRSAVVGYYIAGAARGCGVATAAVGALVRVAQDDLGLVRLVADIVSDNVASRHVAERNGFRSVGRVVVEGTTYERFVVGLPTA